MDATTPPRPTLRAVDPVALRRVRRRLMTAPEAPWLHAEVARRMAERLPVIVQKPDVILDWWQGAGASGPLLRRAYPRAQVVGVEADAPPAGPAPPWWMLRGLTGRARSRLAASAIEPGSAGLVWANMMLHWVADPQAEMERWFDALTVDGFLMFSTLGPGSLSALRAVYVDRRWPAPHAPFVDMHDLGDMLVHAGFSAPVMDQETLTLTWRDGEALLSELRSLGANADPSRYAGLRTRRWRESLLQALQQGAEPTPPGLSMTFEIVYGHAFKPAPRVTIESEVTLGLEAMRSILKDRRKR